MAGQSTMMGSLGGMLASKRENSRLGPLPGIWSPRWCWRTLHILAWSPWKRIGRCWSLFWSGPHHGQIEMATKTCRETKSAENSWGSILVCCLPPSFDFPYRDSLRLLDFPWLYNIPACFRSWKEATAEMGVFFFVFSISRCKKMLWFLLGSSYKLWIG